MAPPLTGRLLVASPLLQDPNFVRTVILMLAHGEEGALGVVLNRPTEVDVDVILPAWRDLLVDPPYVFVGGPVARDNIVCLGDRRSPEHLTEGHGPTIVGNVGTIDLHRDPADVATAVGGLRVFSGYAGWAPGQLEAELAESSWFVLDADPGDALTPQPLHLWGAVLERSGGRYRYYAKAPENLSNN